MQTAPFLEAAQHLADTAIACLTAALQLPPALLVITSIIITAAAFLGSHAVGAITADYARDTWRRVFHGELKNQKIQIDLLDQTNRKLAVIADLAEVRLIALIERVNDIVEENQHLRNTNATLEAKIALLTSVDAALDHRTTAKPEPSNSTETKSLHV